MDITTQWFNYLHTQRKLSQQVISLAGLDVYNGRLKIPVYDEDGNYKFSKFRKAPWDESDEPKYKYEFGASVSLYGANKIGKNIVICEGELDVLALLSCGFSACTSTGGAMSFQKEWVPLFKDSNVTIMFDNDDAGIKGAVKTGFMFKKFTYRWVPPRFGKDVSDVLINDDEDTLKAIMENKECALDFDIPELKTKKEMHEYRRQLKYQVRDMTHGNIGALFIRAMVVELSTKLAERKRKPLQHVEGTDVEKARAYPIENIIEVNRDGFALCPFHTEKSPSFKIYKDNHAYCFGGCGRRADSIDVARQVWGLDFKNAVERLIK
jgi:DNA primase